MPSEIVESTMSLQDLHAFVEKLRVRVEKLGFELALSLPIPELVDRFLEFVETASGFNIFFNKVKREKREELFNRIHNQLPVLIKTVDDLVEVCNCLTVSQSVVLFAIMKNQHKFRNLFGMSGDVDRAHRSRLTTSKYLALIDVIRDQLPALSKASNDILMIYNAIKDEQKCAHEFLSQIQPRLSELIKTSKDAQTILPLFSAAEQEQVFPRIKNQLLEFIKQGEGSCIAQCHPISDKILKEDVQPQLLQFKKIFNALTVGETHFVSSSSEQDFVQSIQHSKKDAFGRFAEYHKYAQANPKSRVAEALRLAERSIPDKQLALEIYKSAFKRSAWYARSCVSGCTLFSSKTVDKISEVGLGKAAMMVGTRYWKICQSLKAKPKPAAPAEAKLEPAPASAKPNNRR